MLQVTLRRAGAEDVEHVKWALYTRSCGTRTASCRRSRSRSSTTRRPAITATGGVPRISGSSQPRTVASSASHTPVCSRTTTTAMATSTTRRLRSQSPFARTTRGRGLGGWLLNELAQAAEAEGFTRLSLSVAADNPARRLYVLRGRDRLRHVPRPGVARGRDGARDRRRGRRAS